ncbi:NSFL1 cofactor p47 [Drosophila kikkawai]|uniref:NSFL1 cofactor p47 n=1 Tax=Drosophila kikkawai TaxID=30033 RepID=A0A6P4I337_DROKI|nr:NSFL1 cofactor p47 [Drosophila kikkawai]
MTDEQKLSTFMKRHGVQKEVARRYLSSNNWSLEVASNIYESETAAKKEAEKSGAETQEKPTAQDDSQKDLQTQISQQNSDQSGYRAGTSDNSTAGHETTVEKRVGIGNSTPALTTIDSDRSLRVWGHGVTLGSAHPINPPPARPPGEDSDNENPEDEHTIVVLHLWSEGFSLNDGSLRLYALPENERFLSAVLRGDYPEEILNNHPHLQLSVQDHTNESFRHLSRKQFMGPGRSLNSPSPQVGVGGTLPVQFPTMQINEGAAITIVQLRLADGSRVAGRFNLTHNIGDLYRYVRMARPQYSSRNFVLMTAFPRQELLETDTRTLVQANLCNVVVIQHLSEEQATQLSTDSSELILK